LPADRSETRAGRPRSFFALRPKKSAFCNLPSAIFLCLLFISTLTSSLLAAEPTAEEKAQRAKQAEEIFARAREARKMKVVVFGSSVAWGQGAENNHGWAARLAQVIEPRGWTLVNKSVPGDNTVKLLARFHTAVLPEKPQVVILALSLANEGLVRQPDPEAIFFRYRENMRKLVQLCRQNGIVPIVTGVYVHGAYTPQQYQYAKNMNCELDSWSVATVDFMGAVDDGAGHWGEGLFKDPGHPNDAGHEALFRAFPPSILDCLIAEAPRPLRLARSALTIPPHAREQKEGGGLSYQPRDPLRSYTLAVEALLDTNAPGTIMVAGGNVIELAPGGKLSVKTGAGKPLAADKPLPKNKAAHLSLVHSAPQKKSTLLVDGKEVLFWQDDSEPPQFFALAGPGVPACGEYRHAALYRVALRPDQVSQIASGLVLKSGLEIFSALDDAGVAVGTILNNQAPTEAAWVVHGKF